MRYLLDTNVLSELVRNQPSKKVLDWVAAVDNSQFHISVLTLGKLRYGIEKQVGLEKRGSLRLWLEQDLKNQFEGRCFDVDDGVVDRWARLRVKEGRPLPQIDALIAATALHHDCYLVTRNEKDFQYEGLPVINPWK